MLTSHPRRPLRSSSSRPKKPALLAALAVACLTGCGPFGYLKKVAKDASKALADAEAAEAEKYAPYEYWGAVAYLDQAKVLMAYSEYERSFDYGVRSKQLAEEAKRKADMRETGSTTERLDEPAESDEAQGEDGGDGAEAEGSISVGGRVGGGK